MTSDPSQPLHKTGANVDTTAAQQQILDRIDVQRKRLRARSAAHAQAVEMARSAPVSGGTEGSLAVRLLNFAREHPFAVAGLVAVAAVAGPRRLVRWTSLALPIVLRMRR